MSDWSEQVYPHGELEQVADRLWRVQGSLKRSPVPRNMFVYRLDGDGGLLVYSAVAMNEARMAQLDALGPVRVILVPSSFHRLQARAYLGRYPKARVLCPAAGRDHVAKEVTVHGAAEEELPKLGVTCHAPAGVKPTELTFEFPVAGGAALIFCDALFNLPHQPGLGGLLVRAIGSSGFLGVTKIGKLFLLSDRKAFKAWLTEQASRTDLVLIGVAHGDVVSEDCAGRLAQAAARL